MKSLMLALACVALISSPALACRGVVEYPAARAQLAQADMTPAEKAALTKKLDAGWALHQQGHREIDPKKMKESIEILDAIKAKIGM